MAEEKRTRKRPIEQYDHKGKQRVNNPPVGLVTPERDPDKGKKTYAYDPHIDPALQFDSQGAEIEALIDQGLAAQDLEEVKGVLAELKRRREPYLNWAGKAERTSFEVDTVSLHVHERLDPRTIIEAVRRRNGVSYKERQPSLFECREENPPLREAVQFYRHKHNWSNRLMAGDSLQVMNSLLEKEGLAGQVQMIYIDPPYGIKYGSNFQPFVNRRDVKDGKDEDLTQEPEMIKAFRDTWELGIHSYLTYLRDRLLLARELLNESGSIFIQINAENNNIVSCLMNEIFGVNNFVANIIFRKKSLPLGAKLLETMHDHILFYAKNRDTVKYRHLYEENDVSQISQHGPYALYPDGSWEKIDISEFKSKNHPKGTKYYRLFSLIAPSYSPQSDFIYDFEGSKYSPPSKGAWIVDKEKLDKLRFSSRLQVEGKSISYRYLFDDFPYKKITNFWLQTAISYEKIFAVQTSPQIIEQCLLMTTDPGDLVLDPTCGSGTTAFCAEKWGRRWITCDTSRVAVTLAKQRLLTAVYDYYELAHPEEGVGSGFKYKTVPHITLKAIANNPEIREGMTQVLQ
jgi:adenine-specific DNA-methyltransferase